MSVFSQDSLVVIDSKKDTIVFSEKDIKIDSSQVKERVLPSNFKSKYSDDAFVYELKAKELTWWDRFLAWLADFFKNLFNMTSNETSMNLVEIVLKVLAVLVIIFVIYLIVKAIMNGEGQWIFGKSSDKKVIQYEDIEKNIHLVDFEKLIKDAIKSNEYRVSIRYYYLWVLKKMSEKEIIEWDVEKTNSDYLYEIKDATLQSEFRYISYLYNYTWYGEFDIDEVAFTKAKKSFDNILNKL